MRPAPPQPINYTRSPDTCANIVVHLHKQRSITTSQVNISTALVNKIKFCRSDVLYENFDDFKDLLTMTYLLNIKERIKRFGMSRLRFGRQREGYRLVSSDDSGFCDAQFEEPPPKIPWKAISLASFLFLVGTVLLIVGSLIVTGHIDTKYSDRLWPIIVLGAIMFLPGAYHIRIAYCAYKQYPGYSFSDIPEFQ